MLKYYPWPYLPEIQLTPQFFLLPMGAALPMPTLIETASRHERRAPFAGPGDWPPWYAGRADP